MEKMFKGLFFICIGIFSSFFINIFIIDEILIPDQCVYHSLVEAPKNELINLFYTFGYHPEFTDLNMILTVIVGILFGLFLWKKL